MRQDLNGSKAGGGGGMVTLSGAANGSGSVGSTITTTYGTGSGIITLTTNGASAQPSMLLTGTIFTGTGTTAQPLSLMQPNGTSNATNWSTAGTFIGVNAASGFSGNLIDVKVNGAASAFTVSSAGAVSATGTITAAASLVAGNANNIRFNTRSTLLSPSDGVLELTNNAQTGFTRLQLGGTTSSFPSIKVNGANINIRLADDSADTGLTCGTIGVSGLMTMTNQTTTTGANNGTLLNCPTAGNPTGYLQVNINGAVGKIPYWV